MLLLESGLVVNTQVAPASIGAAAATLLRVLFSKSARRRSSNRACSRKRGFYVILYFFTADTEPSISHRLLRHFWIASAVNYSSEPSAHRAL
jgi:hypothetical protein